MCGASPRLNTAAARSASKAEDKRVADEELDAALAAVDAKTAQLIDVQVRFEPTWVDGSIASALADVRQHFQGLVRIIIAQTDTGREQSLALTALEEASHWANRAIATRKA